MYAMHTPFDLCRHIIDLAPAVRSYGAGRTATRCGPSWFGTPKCVKEMRRMDLSELFDDVAVTGVPAARDEYLNKMPGAADTNGDHCAG
jgi:hypothetical protein